LVIVEEERCEIGWTSARERKKRKEEFLPLV
jgi:hypothetical protein